MKKHPYLEIEVDEDGNIFRLPYVGGNNRLYPRAELSRSVSGTGYAYVKLRGRQYRACRIVAEARIPNPLNLEVVNHKDLDKLNDHPDNLEWTTASENTQHAYDNGAIKRTCPCCGHRF